MKDASFLSIPLGFWGLSLALHFSIWIWATRVGSLSPSQGSGMTLDLSALDPASGPDHPPRGEVWNGTAQVPSPTPDRPRTTFSAVTAVPEGHPVGDSVGALSPGQADQLPRPLEKVEPLYPAEAKKAGIEGVVILQVDIDATGAVKKVGLVQGLGHGCDEAALEALRKTPFQPALRAGVPVPIQGLQVPYRFRLSGTSGP